MLVSMLIVPEVIDPVRAYVYGAVPPDTVIVSALALPTVTGTV